jgi:hypothetical protein
MMYVGVTHPWVFQAVAVVIVVCLIVVIGAILSFRGK